MPPLENTFRVAIFDRFLESFARIPRAQQRNVNKFLRQFRANPTSASINYEKIHSFKDPNLRTVRIDKAYRAIILRPEKGNVFVLLWVDHHDEAMRWARNKRVQVHPETGSLQVFTLAAPEEVIEEAPAPSVPEEAPVAEEPEEEAPAPVAEETPAPVALPEPLFQQYSSEALLGIGVPEALLPRVRAIRDEPGLAALAGDLPPEAHEGLGYLAEDLPLDEVRRALGIGEKPAAVDTEDFAAALEAPSSRRSFAVVDDDETLVAMLEAPLEKWRVFLHPSQERLVRRSWRGPVRVLGGAGTGKTVVAMHRAAWLVQERFTRPDDRILFTTYTRNLAADIAANLQKLIPNPADQKRVEVVHLDKWVSDFLSRQGYSSRVAYWRWNEGQLWALWREAMDQRPQGDRLPETFYREEWEYIVQPQGCATRDDYVRADRTGRGVPLFRKDRKAIWPVFREYRDLLEENGLKESEDAMRDAAALLTRLGGTLPYRSIVVDESQDMSTLAFRMLRAMVPERMGDQVDDLFLVGDGHQKIYRRRVVLGRAGVKIVGRSHRLRVNYRTTDEIRRSGVALLEGLEVEDMDGGLDTTQGYRSLFHGARPAVARCQTFTEEADAIAAFVQAGETDRTCLVTRTNALLDRYAAALEARGIPSYKLSRARAEDLGAPGVRLATMHRVKGLEFDRVILAGVNRGTVPLGRFVESTSDLAVQSDYERQERALLYVAITRARRDVLVTAHGPPSEWLAALG